MWNNNKSEKRSEKWIKTNPVLLLLAVDPKSSITNLLVGRIIWYGGSKAEKDVEILRDIGGGVMDKRLDNVEETCLLNKSKTNGLKKSLKEIMLLEASHTAFID